jgi:hypothetical protein
MTHTKQKKGGDAVLKKHGAEHFVELRKRRSEKAFKQGYKDGLITALMLTRAATSLEKLEQNINAQITSIS